MFVSWSRVDAETPEMIELEYWGKIPHGFRLKIFSQYSSSYPSRFRITACITSLIIYYNKLQYWCSKALVKVMCAFLYFLCGSSPKRLNWLGWNFEGSFPLEEKFLFVRLRFTVNSWKKNLASIEKVSLFLYEISKVNRS